MATNTGSLTTTGSVSLTPVNGSVTTVALSGTYGTLTFVFEGSLDGSNFFPIAAIAGNNNSTVAGTIAPTDDAELYWQVPSANLFVVRARATALSTGTATFTMVSSSPVGLLSPLPSGTATSSILSFPIVLATVADGDILTTFTPGFAGKITKVDFAVTTKVTTGSKLSTLNLEIGTTNLTGGAVALTSANCTPLGAVVAGTAVTGNNSFSATDNISIEASSTTAFSEGAGSLLVTIQNT